MPDATVNHSDVGIVGVGHRPIEEIRISVQALILERCRRFLCQEDVALGRQTFGGPSFQLVLIVDIENDGVVGGDGPIGKLVRAVDQLTIADRAIVPGENVVSATEDQHFSSSGRIPYQDRFERSLQQRPVDLKADQ